MSIKLGLSHLTIKRTNEVISMFNSVKDSVRKLHDVPVKKSKNRAFIEIKKHANLATLDSDVISIKNGDKKYSLISESPHLLRIVERGLKSKHIENDLLLDRGALVRVDLLQAKHKNLDDYLNSVFELFDGTFLKLRRAFSDKKFVSYINSFVTPKSLGDYNQKQVDDIIALYKSVDEKIISIQNPQTRSGVKNGYANIKKGILGSKQLDFIDVNGKSYSVNILIDAKKKSNLVIGVSENGETKHIIVEPDGKVLKSKKINKRHDTGKESVYYLGNEVDSPFITKSLLDLKSELVEYDKFVTKRLNELKTYRYKYSTDDIGVIKNSVMDRIIDMREKRKLISEAMKWLKNESRENANKKLGIRLGNGKNNSITLKRVGPYKETIHLSFPILDNNLCTKILILNRNNDVEKTYLIKEQNLVKFEAKNTSTSKWAKTMFHYHSQNEVNNSSLNIYADEIQTRLEEISQIISKKDWWK